MLILIDQDGVLANFEQGMQTRWQQKYGEPLPITADQRKHFYFADDLPHLRSQVYEIFSDLDFFAHLPPIDGAIEAMHALLDAGHDVRICTAPINAYRYCVGEKFAWVEEHLGHEWIGRIVLTKDKTWVRGDILIDDKPSITGSLTPLWQHWIYDQPYNRSVDNGLPRVTWTDKNSWASLLEVENGN